MKNGVASVKYDRFNDLLLRIFHCMDSEMFFNNVLYLLSAIVGRRRAILRGICARSDLRTPRRAVISKHIDDTAIGFVARGNYFIFGKERFVKRKIC